MGTQKTKRRLSTAQARIQILEHALAYYASLPEVVYVPEWKDYVGGTMAQKTLEISSKMAQDDIDLYGINEANDED